MLKPAVTSAAVLLIAVAACGEVTTGLDRSPEAALSAAFSESGTSGCYTVRFTTHVVGVFPSFAGTMSGDLVGTTTVEFDPAATVASGVTSQVDGINVWTVTGGSVPEFVGASFETYTFARNLFSPDNDPLLFEINGKDRAKTGVEKANLTYRGVFDAEDLAPPFDVRLAWNGVICP